MSLTERAVAVSPSLNRNSVIRGQSPHRAKTAVIVRPQHFDLVYPQTELERLAATVELLNDSPDLEDSLWPEIEIVLGGWGMPVLDEAFLRRASKLKAVFYAAGSVRSFMTDAAWDRGLIISNAAAANSRTTAEFCFSEILFSLKHGWRFSRDPRRAWKNAYVHEEIPGLYGSRVGLVSFGRVARHVAQLLSHFEIEVMGWDPHVADADFMALGVTPCDLQTLFSTSDVVSLHVPLLAETRHLIDADLLARMRTGATLINTSRGEVVNEEALIDLLAVRHDLTAVLDVTENEPPSPDSRLFELPNVVMTPHLAGCYGPECRRMGVMAIEEMQRFVNGLPLKHRVGRQQARLMA